MYIRASFKPYVGPGNYWRVYLTVQLTQEEEHVMPSFDRYKKTLESGAHISITGGQAGRYTVQVSVPKKGEDVLSWGEHPVLRDAVKFCIEMFAQTLNQAIQDLPIEEEEEIEVSTDYKDMLAAITFALSAMNDSNSNKLKPTKEV